jgi:hypothetical protein
MTEEKILCHHCGKELVMKFIELKDLVFCSSSCFENFKGSMSRKDFFKNYGDGFTPDEQRWVPKYSNDYIKMCGYCPKKLAETCHEELECTLHTEFGHVRWDGSVRGRQEGSETSRRNNPQTGDKNCNHD